MKRIAAIFMILVMTVSMAACGSNETAAPEENTTAPETQENSQNSQSSGTLIAYFSLGENMEQADTVDASTSASILADNGDRYGTTEYVANLIRQETGGDIHTIQTKEAYPADFDAVVSQNHEEQDAGIMPELSESDLDMSQYDTVFIGYPIWATNAPQAIFSFLSEYDLSDKTVVPFCTHDGYGAGSSYTNIAELISNEKEVLEGLAIEAEDVQDSADTVKQWLQDIGISGQKEETAIKVTIGDVTLDGVLYDTALAGEIQNQFPLTVSMGGFGGREYYGGIGFTPENTDGGQLYFENGDITYCSTNNTMAIFYAQTDNPDLTMEVIPVGKITSDLKVFDELPDHVDVTFSFAE